MKEPKNRIVSKTKSTQSPHLSVAGVIARIETDPRLDAVKRRDMASGLRRLCSLLDRDPASMPAFMPELAEALARVSPVREGISRKTLANIKANALSAFRHLGINQSKGNRYAPLTEAWRVLFDRLDHGQRSGMSRFIHYCSDNGITPAAVNDAVVDGYLDFVRANTLKTERQIRDIHRRTTRLWNQAINRIPGWSRSQLAVPDYRKPIRRPLLGSYSSSFEADIDAYCAWLRDRDPFAEHRPPQRCAPRTIRLRRQHVISAAAALVEGGGDAEALRCLADLVEPERVKILLRQRIDGDGGKISHYTRAVALTLVGVAQHWVRVGAAHLRNLKDIKRRLGSNPIGLTDKNRAVLRAFDDEATLRRLLQLPQDLFEDGLSGPRDDKRLMVRAQTAIAIEILLMTVIRIGNLISLRFDHELIRPAGKRGLFGLSLNADQVKNEEAIDFDLPRPLTDMIDRYRAHFSPLLDDLDNPYLFPNQDGGHKTQSALAHQICKATRERVGVRVRPHQFRHLAAKLGLKADPGNYEGVRRLLGHKNMKTTTDFYAGLESREAARHYDEQILARRQELEQQEPPRRRKRPTPRRSTRLEDD